MTDKTDMPEGITRDDTVHGETYFTAADMATASAQGFRDGAASVSANAGEPFGWVKQSEIDYSKQFEGSINLWRMRYDCDVPVYLAAPPKGQVPEALRTQQPAPATLQPAPSAAAAVEQETDAVAKRRAKYLRNDTDAGRAYVAQYLRSMGQHYFDDYIQNDLAGDFACALASVLSLSLAQQAPQPSPTPQADSQPAGDYDVPEAVIEAVADALGEAYDCCRVWSAWSCGTMRSDDFSLVAEDGDRVAEIARAAITADRAARAQADSVTAPAGVMSEAKAWRCFHCEEVFTDKDSAALHFGASERQQAYCTIPVEHFRWMEEQQRRYFEEDTESHRTIHRLHLQSFENANRSEERGYARGLEDAKKYPHELGLMAAPQPTPPAQAADSVLEDAARKAIDKVLALFPFNAPIQTFTIGGGPHLTADGDTEFYSAKRIWALLREVKTTLDAARKQGANHD